MQKTWPHLDWHDVGSEYHQAVYNLVWTFRESITELNVTKTKELCWGSREKPDLQQPIEGQLVQQEQSFKYRGMKIDTYYSFSQHRLKKAQHRLHLLRKLTTFNVKDILTLVHRTLIDPILQHIISVQRPTPPNTNISIAQSVIKQDHFQPLHQSFQLLPLGPIDLEKHLQKIFVTDNKVIYIKHHILVFFFSF